MYVPKEWSGTKLSMPQDDVKNSSDLDERGAVRQLAIKSWPGSVLEVANICV